MRLHRLADLLVRLFAGRPIADPALRIARRRWLAVERRVRDLEARIADAYREEA